MTTAGFAHGDAGHGPARGYRSMVEVLRAYWRKKDGAAGRAASRTSSGGRRKANAKARCK